MPGKPATLPTTHPHMHDQLTSHHAYPPSLVERSRTTHSSTCISTEGMPTGDRGAGRRDEAAGDWGGNIRAEAEPDRRCQREGRCSCEAGEEEDVANHPLKSVDASPILHELTLCVKLTNSNWKPPLIHLGPTSPGRWPKLCS